MWEFLLPLIRDGGPWATAAAVTFMASRVEVLKERQNSAADKQKTDHADHERRISFLERFFERIPCVNSITCMKGTEK